MVVSYETSGEVCHVKCLKALKAHKLSFCSITYLLVLYIYMELDEAKIENKRLELGNDYFVADGLHAITTVDFSSGSTPQFNPAQGIISKVFISQTSGEIKMFPAVIFKKDGV